jgi:hypothetical protein
MWPPLTTAAGLWPGDKTEMRIDNWRRRRRVRSPATDRVLRTIRLSQETHNWNANPDGRLKSVRTAPARHCRRAVIELIWRRSRQRKIVAPAVPPGMSANYPSASRTLIRPRRHSHSKQTSQRTFRCSPLWPTPSVGHQPPPVGTDAETLGSTVAHLNSRPFPAHPALPSSHLHSSPSKRSPPRKRPERRNPPEISAAAGRRP